MTEFMRNFNSSCIEHLIIWFSQYSLSERIKIIEFIQQPPARVMEEQQKHGYQYPHKDCSCRKLFDQLPQKTEINLNSFEFCVDTIPKRVAIHTLPTTNHYGQFVAEVCSSTKSNSKKRRQKPRVYSRSRRQYFIQPERNKIFTIEPFTLLHAVVLYYRPLTLQVFEKMLPVTWRSFDRTSYDRFKLTPNLLLHLFEKMIEKQPSVYFYPTVQECADWQRRARSLPREIEEYLEEDVFVQPNLCGFHIIVHKYRDAVKFYTQYGIRLRLPLKLDMEIFESRQFLGEFMIMPMTGSEWLHKRYTPLATHFKFVVLDLYEYGGSNWTDCSYGQRRLVCQNFIQKNTQIDIVPVIENINGLETRYREEFALRAYPHFCGIVFRPKTEIWTPTIYKFSFEAPARMEFAAMRSGIHGNPDSFLNVQDTIHVPVTTKHKTLVPYILVSNGSGGRQSDAVLLSFNGNYFVPFQKIRVSSPNAYRPLCKYVLMVNNKQSQYGILKIRYNHKGENNTICEIVSVEPQYDKTLLDCVEKLQ